MKALIQLSKGIVTSVLITLILLFIFSVLLTYTDIKESTMPTVTIIITAISIFVGSSISTIKLNKNGLVNGGAIGFIYVFLLYIISSIVQIGFTLNTYSIITIILAIIAGMIGGIMGVNIKVKQQ